MATQLLPRSTNDDSCFSFETHGLDSLLDGLVIFEAVVRRAI